MFVSNTSYTNTLAIPASFEAHAFIESIGIDNNPANCKYAALSVVTTATTVSLSWNAASNTQPGTIKYLKAFVLVFDLALRTSTMRFKYLSWNWISGTLVSITPINANADRTIYTIDVIPS